MDFEELNKLVKFISNRVDYYKFRDMMMKTYNDEGYIEPLWPSFRDNPTLFIVGRRETKLFELILAEIEETGYRG